MGDKRPPPISVRLPDKLRQEVDAAVARTPGLTRNDLIVKSLERTLHIKAMDDELPPEAHPCTHPRETLRRFAYGTFCGAPLPSGTVCGVRIR